MELERYDRMRQIAMRDFDVFSGYALKRYFHWKFIEDETYTAMGAWWNRKGENEIDLVCDDEFENRLDFCEVKRDATRVDMTALAVKSEAFLAANPSLRQRTIHLRALSLADV